MMGTELFRARVVPAAGAETNGETNERIGKKKCTKLRPAPTELEVKA